MAQSTRTTISDLPLEIAVHVCKLLKQSETSELSLSSKSIYNLIRPILYRHPLITSFTSLTLFNRTLTRATYMGKVDRKWSEQECIDQTRFMRITLDSATENGQLPAAILISRNLQSIER